MVDCHLLTQSGPELNTYVDLPVLDFSSKSQCFDLACFFFRVLFWREVLASLVSSIQPQGLACQAPLAGLDYPSENTGMGFLQGIF